MNKIEYPECINDEAKTLDCYIFDYFNNAYPDVMCALLEEWKKKVEKPKESAGESDE